MRGARAVWADPLHIRYSTWNSYEYSRVCARDHQREVLNLLYKERGENNGRPDP